MKPTDQELQKIAERCVIEINDGQKIIHNIQNKVRLYNPILKALTQVRDAQEEKLKIAMDCILKLKKYNERSDDTFDDEIAWFIREALKRMGGE